MAKDPAFLFYTGDFSTGTQFMTDDQVGKYIRLLMAQHQHGRLSEKQVIFICKSFDEEVMSKFKKDDDGLFYNERLETEVSKRKSFSESRSNNKKGKTKDINNTSKSYDLSSDNHMEDKDENENEDKNEDVKKDNTLDGYGEFIIILNSATNKNYKGCSKSKKQFVARVKEGRTMDEFKSAAENAVKDLYHKENNFKYLTPEFLTRADKLDKFCQLIEVGTKTIKTQW